MSEHPNLLQLSSHYKNWIFTLKEINDLRQKAHEEAKKYILENSEIKNVPTIDDGMLLIQECMLKASRLCVKYMLKEIVWSATVTCIKRFYLKNSFLEFPPGPVMVASLFLSSKTCNASLKLSTLMTGISGTTKDEIKRLEYIIAESLSFQFFFYNVFEPCLGIFLDFQASMRATDDKYPMLFQTYTHVVELATIIEYTDLNLIYTCSQIAMACWVVASRNTGLPFDQYQSIKKNVFDENMENASTIFDDLIEEIISKFPDESFNPKATCGSLELKEQVVKCSKVLSMRNQETELISFEDSD